ncbi:protein-serine,threonine phosphatase [Sarracenia purpurea var. burkii]
MSDSELVLKEPQSNFYDMPKTNESIAYEIGDAWNFDSISQYRNRLQSVAFEEGLNHIARYVESFESRSNDLWLVFLHEGVSLSKILYTTEEVECSADDARDEHAKNVQVLYPSKWWHWLKTTGAGQEEMRNIIWQLLMAHKSCHDRNITHRDIKPENMVICFEDQNSGRCLKGIPSKDKKYTTKMYLRILAVILLNFFSSL